MPTNHEPQRENATLVLYECECGNENFSLTELDFRNPPVECRVCGRFQQWERTASGPEARLQYDQ